MKNLYQSDCGLFLIRNSSGKEMARQNPAKNLFEKNASTEKILNSPNSCVFRARSDTNGWEYIYVLPDSVANKSIRNAKIIVIIITLVCLLIGIWLVYIFANMNYKPLRTIMSLFPQEQQSEKDEYQFLQDQISGVIDESEKMQQLVNNQRSMIRNHLLNNLLSGNKSYDRHNKIEYENLVFDLDLGSFITVVINTPVAANNQKDRNERFYIYYASCNVLDEVLGNLGYTFYSLEKNESVVYMIEIKGTLEEAGLHEAVDLANSIIAEEFDADLYCAIGRVHSGENGIFDSFSDALSVLEYCTVNSLTGTVSYDSISDKITKSYFYSLEQENRLINYIKDGNADKMAQELEKIFAENQNTDSFSINSARYLSIDLFNTLKKTLLQYGKTPENVIKQYDKVTEDIFSCNSIELMREMIRNAYKTSIQALADSDEHEDDIVESVVKYLRQNYPDINLSISSIAEDLDMNHNYLSRKFKESTGMRIGDYLNNLRVEEAKTLLLNMDNLVSDIAGMVGFSSYRTFVRVFSNVTGVTPKKYRTMKSREM